MYLKRLELQGFKTFAQKTVLEFVLDPSGRRGITAIVGPNGSGKSNIADALRWVMGEQSLKLLRGKKSEDVVFSGSSKRARSGFAEVIMTIENDTFDDLPSEISITRRLYRDGQSEYEVGRQGARLQDIVMLLAQCGIGQRTYSVIGQGMVDAVLVASPVERKEFFDEAFGLRTFQLKKHAALNKIEQSRENLRQTEALLHEIGPRLATLERQMKRLEERDSIEKELRELERVYYGSQWNEIRAALKAAQDRCTKAQAEQDKYEREAKDLEVELEKMEKAVPSGQGFRELRERMDKLAAERSALRERELKLETARVVEAARAEKPWSPLPLSKIIEGIEALRSKHERLYELVATEKIDVKAVRALIKELSVASGELVGKLQRPASEPEITQTAKHKLQNDDGEIKKIREEITEVDQRIKQAETDLEAWNHEEEGKRAHVFEVQHRLNRKRDEARAADERMSAASVELARVETRRDGFLAEVRAQAPHLESKLDALVGAPLAGALGSAGGQAQGLPLPVNAAARLQRLRSQIEWIGGIDPESIKEHGETKERFGFLSKQTEDLKAGIAALELVVIELETTIRERSQTAFRALDVEFGAYFKKLFGGGDAKLVEVEPEPETDEEGNIISEPEEGEVAGIDIQATPPGKRAKSIALLSGGERALTSIALICAIMATNPSPFVVLDEVDAALDELNSRKFAEIVNSLADQTQFIVVTHNRATMAEANVLYGVTMGEDGVSQLLSVKLAEVERLKQGA